jgi:hypothetical protein
MTNRANGASSTAARDTPENSGYLFMLTGYPGSTRKPGSANIIRTRKRHKEQKSAPGDRAGHPSPEHASPEPRHRGRRHPHPRAGRAIPRENGSSPGRAVVQPFSLLALELDLIGLPASDPLRGTQASPLPDPTASSCAVPYTRKLCDTIASTSSDTYNFTRAHAAHPVSSFPGQVGSSHPPLARAKASRVSAR